ncbi:MAG: tRNA (guanosine(46)-N7)-methyltransferase TrmB [Coleofasciculaceae cyanobacterium]
MPRVRVRQHVNPFHKRYQTPVTPPNWEKVYDQFNKPLHLDIGCGRGEFLLRMAVLEPDWNFLGLEIREPLVERANTLVDELGLTNLCFLFGNASNCLPPIFQSFPGEFLQRVTIQFPDPWFKKRHAKRRVLQPELVNDLANYLSCGGMVFLQSDVKEVAQEMCNYFEANPAFSRQDEDWLMTNPLPVPTERETLTLSRREPVYRALFSCSKKNHPI